MTQFIILFTKYILHIFFSLYFPRNFILMFFFNVGGLFKLHICLPTLQLESIICLSAYQLRRIFK